LDVRDIVNAYRMIATNPNVFGRPEYVYNVCSGVPTKIHDLLDELIKLSDVAIDIIYAPEKFRPIDVDIYVGSRDRIRDIVGWEPQIPLRSSLQGILEDWRSRLLRGNNNG
jgi:GDP-4-dehydro-6-deoxy-D-mannose reductase